VALSDEVISRYANSRVKQLTNPGVQSPAGINAVILALAAGDVEEEFEEVVGVVYDNSNRKHVAIAVRGVIATLALQAEAAGATANALHERYIEGLERLAKVTGRDRIPVTTSSQVTPTDERQTTEIVRPWSDHPHFDDLVARPPDS